MSHDYWEADPVREKTLKDLWGKVTVREIANAVQQASGGERPSRNAIIGKAHRLGLRKLRDARTVGGRLTFGADAGG